MKEKLIKFLIEKSIFPSWDIERIVDSILENEIDENSKSWELSQKYSKDGHPYELKF